MPSLSSLIVQRQIATVLEVEQAIARQVIHGGDLVTNLLEVAPSCEPGLNAVLGESVGLPPTPWGRLAAPEAEILALIPAELCLGHGFFPLRLDGHNIVIATPSPLAPSVEDTLRFSLSKGLMQLASPTIRVREGIAAHYGIPLDARQLKLVQKLDEAMRVRGHGYDGRGLTSSPPSRGHDEELGPLSLPKVPSMIPSTLESGVHSEETGPTGWGAASTGSRPSAANLHQVEPYESDARAVMVPPFVEVPSAPPRHSSAPPPRVESSILPPRVSTVPPPGKPTLFDPIAQSRADEMSEPSSRVGPARGWDVTPAPPTHAPPTHAPPTPTSPNESPINAEQEAPASAHLRDTVPVPGDALDAMEAAMLGTSGAPDPLHPDAMTRRAPEVVSFEDPDQDAPSTEPSDRFGVSLAAADHVPDSVAAIALRPTAASESATPTSTASEGPTATAASTPSNVPGPSASTRPPSPSVLPDLDDSPPPPSIVNQRAIHRVLLRELQAKRRGRTARRKGPFARADAEKELEAASSAEELVDIFFAFASQFFEYSALFLVHGDIAEGRDAWGPGTDREKVLGIGVPLDLPSSFARARSEGAVIFTRMIDEDLDAELRRDLGRARARGATQVAVVPVALRGRSVALLYGDDGSHDVTVSQLGDLFGFAALASANLERVALQKKRGQVPSKRRPQTGNVEALARSFGLPGSEAGPPSHAPENVVVSPGATSIQPPPQQQTNDAVFAATVDASQVQAWAAPIGPPRGSLYGEDPEAAEAPSSRRAYGYESAEPDLVAATAPDDDEVRVPTYPELDPIVPEVTQYYDDTSFASRRGEPGRISAPASPREADATLLGPSLPGPDLLGRAPGAPSGGSAPDWVQTARHDGDSPRSHRDDFEQRRESHADRGHDTHHELDAHRAPDLQPPARVAAARPAAQPPLRREEDDDASHWLVEQGGTPVPPAPRAPTARRAEYAIIPDRTTGSDPQLESQRARDAALFGPYGPLLMKATLGGMQAEEALAALEREAEHSLGKLVAVFPGPLLVDRFRLRDQLPPASECGPLLKLLVMLRRHSLGFMTVRSTSTEVDQRFWATHVIGELQFPEAAPALLPRLFDDDVMVRRVARRSATSLVMAGAAGEPLKTSLENMIQSQDEPTHRRVLAIESMGEIRAAQMLPVLIGALADSSEAIVEAARCSLMLIARQDLGQSSAAWETWWQMNRHKHRVEWLIDGLTHDTASVRRAAGDELKQITKEYFGYYDDLPPRERERAQQKYRDWWAEEGQFRFR